MSEILKTALISDAILTVKRILTGSTEADRTALVQCFEHLIQFLSFNSFGAFQELLRQGDLRVKLQRVVVECYGSEIWNAQSQNRLVFRLEVEDNQDTTLWLSLAIDLSNFQNIIQELGGSYLDLCNFLTALERSFQLDPEGHLFHSHGTISVFTI